MQRKIIGIFVCMLLMITSTFPNAKETSDDKTDIFGEILDQHQEYSDECYYIDDFEWQEFVPTLDNLVRVEVKIAQWNENSLDLQLSIEKPLGNILTSLAIPASSIPGTCNWVSFDVPDIDLTIGESYYIKLTAPQGSEYGWGIAWNDLYPQGDSSQPPGDWCFRTYAEEAGNLCPTVSITNPIDGGTVNGTMTVTGEAHDPDGDWTLEWVMVKIDDGSWEYAYGISDWSYVWDTTTVFDGDHIISAITSDGSLQSIVDTISVTVDNGGGTGGNADLIVTDVWEDNGNICYQIRNIGNNTCPSGHNTALYVDGNYQVSDLIDTVLSSDERFTSCFDYDWECIWLNVSVSVVADYENLVEESNESNNGRGEFWKCDTTTPKIIYGPVAQQITQNSVVIYWKTDENSDSTVRFDSYAEKYNEVVGDSEYVKEHSIKLTNLDSGATYHFIVESSDNSGNMVRSQDFSFQTLPSTDNTNPSLLLQLPDNLSGIVDISADASDNVGVDRVIFYCDGEQMYTDYSAPYKCKLDSKDLEDGTHIFDAEAIDAAGNIADDSLLGDVQNRFPDVLSPVRVRITNLVSGDSVSGGVYIDVEVTHNLNFSIKYIVVEIDGVLLEEKNYSCGYRIMDPFTGRMVDWLPSVYPTPPVYVTFMWDTSGLEFGSTHVIEVGAQDEEGNWGHTGISVIIAEPPDIEITRDVTRNGNYFIVNLTAENRGGVAVEDLTIEDTNAWFQCLNSGWIREKTSGGDWQSWDQKTYEVITDPSGDLCTIRSGNIGTLEANAAIMLQYYAVPVLSLDEEFYEFGNLLRVSYQPRGGEIRTDTPPTRWLLSPDEENAAFYDADYLLVTCPYRLFDNHDNDDVNELLALIAQLASEKDGVLGYISSSTPNYGLQRLISPGGKWYEKLRCYRVVDMGLVFTSRGTFDYLLLVGETEIVPSYETLDFNFFVDITGGIISLSDHAYADNIGNDGLPDLRVGRIIGDTAKDLIIPIRTSLSGFNDGSDALMVSGPEGTWEQFVRNIHEVGDILRGKGATVEELDWEYYTDDIRLFGEALLIAYFPTSFDLDPATPQPDPYSLSLEDMIRELLTRIGVIIEPGEELTYLAQAQQEAERIQEHRRGADYGSYLIYDNDALAAKDRNINFKGMVPNKDIIFFTGHGDPGGWCGGFANWAGVPDNTSGLSFSSSNPVILAVSCCTGDYEPPFPEVDLPCSIAEVFLANSASVYIGSTEVSICDADHGEEYGRLFFRDYWRSDQTIGEIFTNFERGRMLTTDSGWRFTVKEFNLYGDPKFGGLPSSTYSLLSERDKLGDIHLSNITPDGAPTVHGAAPPSFLELTIPEYLVDTMGDFDYVEIPGGDILLEEEGRPRVPYYSTSIVYPKGLQVQNVILRKRSGFMTEENLTLSVVTHEHPELPIEMREGWYPETDFWWKCWENDNGSTNLVVVMYPFYYNPQTTQVKFYRNYEFDIEYAHSDVSITALYTDKVVYDSGDKVTINMWLNNSGETHGVVASMVIKEYGTDNIVGGLSLRTLKNCGGICSYSAKWDAHGNDPGSYYVEAIISDISGDLLDKEILRFHIGKPSGEIEIKSISGGFGLSVDVENIGVINATDVKWSITIEGDMVFLGGNREGTIPLLTAGENKKIKTGLVLGFGPAEITVTVAGVSKKASCFILGPLILNVKET